MTIIKQIKQINDDIKRKKLQENAENGDPMAKASLAAFELGLTETSCAEDEEVKFTKQQMADMKKLAKQLADEKEVDAEEMSGLIGDDLELLEYSPEEVEVMVPAVVKMVKELR